MSKSKETTMVKTRAALVSLSSIAAMGATGTSAQTSTLPNWVGPKIGRPIDTACYRKTQRSNQCPLGYDSDKLGGCWAQCPLEYPIACGMECLPQSKDCTLEVITKVGAVANVAINLASSSMFSSLIGSNVSAGLKCGGDLFTVVNKIVQLVGAIQKATPDLPTEKLVLELLKSEVVTSELTAAVIKCAGAPSAVSSAVSAIVKLIIEKIAASGPAVLAPDAFIQLTRDVGLGSSISTLDSSDLAKFKELIANGPACGMQLKNVLDRIIAHIVELKKQNTKITPEQIRIELTKTSLFVKELPALTSQCGSSASSSQNAFDMRDTIRNALQGFIDKVIDAAYQNGNPVPVETYIMVAANLGLDALSGLDSTGIVKMVAEFLQPICGPTSMIGEIDDGPAALALGLRTIDNAFNGSYGQWTKSGDGQVKIVFESKDAQDVTVNVWSGGSQIASVPVAKGQRAEWAKPIADLQDKTLYLDRWRPGFLGLPGTGGGSLLAWVPRSSAGGHFELTAQLNVS